MKKNRLVVLIALFFLSDLVCIVEDKEVESVLPTKKIQRRANTGSVCVKYTDNNYYLYEGEACLFFPENDPRFRGPWNSTAASYNTDILRVYEAKPLSFDGNKSLGAYYYAPGECTAMVIGAIKEGKTDLGIGINNGPKFSVSFIVLNKDDNYLEEMDKQALFTAIKTDDLNMFQALMQRGVSLSLLNEAHESALVALGKKGNPEMIDYLVNAFVSGRDHLAMIELLRVVVATDKPYPVSIIFQNIPFDDLKKIDQDGSLQQYATLNAVVGALEGKAYEIAWKLFAQKYPISSKPGSKGANPLQYAIANNYKGIALRCIEEFSQIDLSVLTKEGLTPLMIALQGWSNISQRGKYQEIVEALLAKMRSEDIAYKNSQGKTALDYAVASQDPIVIILMKKYMHGKIDFAPQEIVDELQKISPGGVWTFQLIQQANEFISTIKDLAQQDKDGNTPLMLALQQHKKEISKLLIQAIPFPGLVTVNRNNESALFIAQKWNKPEIIRLITERITQEEKNYFYDGVAETCSDFVYIPTLDKKAGILSATACFQSLKDKKVGGQEVLIEGASRVYNGRGKLTVLKKEVSGVLYKARPLGEVFGGKNLKEILQASFKNNLRYTTATAALSLSPEEFRASDHQGEIKLYVQETGFFAGVMNRDLALITGLISNNYNPNVLNPYRQNPAMTAFQHKAVEIGRKIFPLISPSGYGQQDNDGKTLIMYVIEAREKEITKKLLNAMTPVDLVKVDKKGNTVYGLLHGAKWKDLLDVLRKKAGQASLFYAGSPQFTYVPNNKGSGGAYTETMSGLSVSITAPNQIVYHSPAGGLATATINKPVGGLSWNDWMNQNGITLSAMPSYSTMVPIIIGSPVSSAPSPWNSQSPFNQAANDNNW